MSTPFENRKERDLESPTRPEDVPDASATLENVGPEGRPLREDDASDVYAGTSSGSGLRGKPEKGSIGDVR